MTEHPQARPIIGVHHGAFRCRDSAQTIWFYKDVLGLVDHTGISLEEVTGTGENDPYLHLFFKMKNGEFIAFFDAPGSANPEWFDRKESFDLHWAFEVGSEEDLLAMQERINSYGVSALGPVDHEFVKSIYMYDPNGIQIELTWRTPRHDEIVEKSAANFDRVLADWQARTRELKVAKFGAEAIDRRSRKNPAAA